jgi:hypothetical protein
MKSDDLKKYFHGQYLISMHDYKKSSYQIKKRGEVCELNEEYLIKPPKWDSCFGLLCTDLQQIKLVTKSN